MSPDSPRSGRDHRLASDPLGGGQRRGVKKKACGSAGSGPRSGRPARTAVGDHRPRLVALDRRRPQGVLAGGARVEEDLGALGPEHHPGVLEEGHDRRIELRRVLQDPARLVQELEPLVLLALGEVRPVGEEDGEQGDDEEPTERGSSHRIDTASRARLVLATATRPPNWIISGQLLELGRPARQGDRGRDRHGRQDGRRQRRQERRQPVVTVRGRGRRREGVEHGERGGRAEAEVRRG